MALGIYTKITVEEPQSVFKSDKPYVMGTQALFVYVNGMLAYVDDSYKEIDALTIEFNEPLEPGDIVLIASSVAAQVINVDFALVGSGNNVLFNRYDTNQHLMNNQEYDLEVRLLNTVHKFKFTSRYSPLYSTVKLIRTDIMDIIDGISDDVINFTIWQNSILAQELATSNTSSTVTLTDTVATTAAKYYVRYKTEIDLVYAIYLAITGKAGKSSKKLGNLQIDTEVTIPVLRNMLDELKKKLSPYENQLTGKGIRGTSFLKAGGTSYPITDRRSF